MDDDIKIIKSVKDKKIREIIEKITNHKLSVSNIEQIIKNLKEKNYHEIKNILEKSGKEDVIDTIINLNEDEENLEEIIDDEDFKSIYFDEKGHKKPEYIDKLPSDDHPINKDTYEKHPAHFRYVSHLVQKLDEDASQLHLRNKLRGVFLGTDKAADTYHGVKMFKDGISNDEIRMNPGMYIRNDFNDEELISISNALIAKMRRHYFQDVLKLTNYDDYVIKNSDSEEVKEEKRKELRYLDTTLNAEMGVNNEVIYKILKGVQDKSGQFGGDVLNTVEQDLFGRVAEIHKENLKNKIMNSSINYKNIFEAQQFLSYHINQTDIPDSYKKEFMHAYQTGDLDKIKQGIQIISPEFNNYNFENKKEYDVMHKTYMDHSEISKLVPKYKTKKEKELIQSV